MLANFGVKPENLLSIKKKTLKCSMKYPKLSFYNWPNYSKEDVTLRHQVAIEILHDFLIMFDTFHQMNGVINIANTDSADFWSVETHFKGVNKIFTLGMIEDEDHKEALFGMVYKMAAAEVGNKNFEDRADKIGVALRAKILELAKS